MSNLNGKAAGGTWRLRVSDVASVDTGTVYAFTLIIVSHSNSYLVAIFNNPPVASNQSVTVNSGTSTNLILRGGDPDGDAITFQTNSLPGHGLLSGFSSSSGSVTYTPSPGYHGPDAFTFLVSDGSL